MPNPPLEIIIFAEAAADAVLARSLAERVLTEHIELQGIPPFRWCGIAPDKDFSPITSIHREYEAQRNTLRLQQHISSPQFGKAHSREYYAWAKAIMMTQQLRLRGKRPICAILMVRDMDNQPERRADMLLARHEKAHNAVVLVATPDPKREAWVLNGFECADPQEQARLDQLRKDLGFNPCLRANKLNASQPGAKRNIKRVLAVLTDGNPDRERDCWEQTPLPTLRQNGPHTGLAAYLDEVCDRLLPLLSSHQP
jgi:hypothetical protein